MSNPFFKNYGPILISNILNILRIKNDGINLNQEVNDIKDLYQTNTGETGIAMVKDGMGDGGNTGVMVLNLEKLRENKFTKFCIEQNNKEPDSDGNIINKYVKKKYEILPSKYNVLQYALNARLSKLAKYNDNFIFHFADKNKPWNYSENFKGKNNRRKFHFLWYSAENYIHSE